MGSDVTIRPADVGDLGGLLVLYRELNPADPVLSPAQADAAFQQMLTRPGLTVFVTEQDNRIVSTATLLIIPNLTRSARPYGLIENVVTLSEMRGSGLGRAVVRHAIHVGFAANCYKVMLLTGRHSEAVHRFYEGCGFVQDKTGFQIRND